MPLRLAFILGVRKQGRSVGKWLHGNGRLCDFFIKRKHVIATITCCSSCVFLLVLLLLRWKKTLLFATLAILYCLARRAGREERKPLVAGTLRGLLRFAKHIFPQTFSTQIQELRGYSLALSRVRDIVCLGP